MIPSEDGGSLSSTQSILPADWPLTVRVVMLIVFVGARRAWPLAATSADARGQVMVAFSVVMGISVVPQNVCVSLG